jgi:O-antigen/teichoic acid export membrane protein
LTATQVAAVSAPEQHPTASSGRVHSGAARLSLAMVASGVLTYAFQVLAARSLGPEAYGDIAVLWAAMFLVVVVLFRPVEQTTSRAIVERRAKGEETRSVVRSGLFVTAGVLVVVALLSAVGWNVIADRLFGGDDLLVALLLAGVVAYAAQYLIRGLLGGLRWFDGYAACLVADGAARVIVAVPLVFIASRGVAGAALVAAAVGGALVPVLYRRRRLAELGHDGPGEPFQLRAALRFAAPAGVVAGADQLLVNGGPLLVILAYGQGAGKEAGIVFAATMLVRAPVYVFQGMATSLLANITHLEATGDTGGLHRALARAATMLLGVGFVIVVGTAAIGPDTLSLLFGDEFQATRTELALLGAGVGAYLAAATCSQALLALDRAGKAAVAWSITALVFVLAYAVYDGEPLMRISVAFALAAVTDLFLLAFLLLARLREAK